MNWNDLHFFPLMGEPLDEGNTIPLNFTASNLELEQVDLGNTETFSNYIFEKLDQAGKTFGIGGYLENRAIYRRSEVFGAHPEEFRNIHMGVDIWTQAGAPVYTPYPGRVHSFQDNASFSNYGPTIILEHSIQGQKIHSLYGHLMRIDLNDLAVGKYFEAGELLCHVGPFPENGDWPAHLHFQLIFDMRENWGDYPGVAAEKDVDFYRKNCPDPAFILGFEKPKA